MSKARSQYEQHILEIIAASTEDCNKFETLANEFMKMYKNDQDQDQDSETFTDAEKKELSDFFFECDAYEPKDSDMWGTKYESTCANEDSLKKSAKKLLNVFASSPKHKD